GTETQPSLVFTTEEIIYFQQLIRRIPVADNVYDYAVKLVSRTRPGTKEATREVNEYIAWGAGPRASQYLIIGAKCHGAISGKYSPDIEDIEAVAEDILRHRLVRNYKAEADSIGVEAIIKGLLA
ncbi:MAG TPA: hypothetical protein VLH61_09360, partial [Bacteroidales bacterium]|nr:hypothetical protein [Bacteroidales bacterium]